MSPNQIVLIVEGAGIGGVGSDNLPYPHGDDAVVDAGARLLLIELRTVRTPDPRNAAVKGRSGRQRFVNDGTVLREVIVGQGHSVLQRQVGCDAVIIYRSVIGIVNNHFRNIPEVLMKRSGAVTGTNSNGSIWKLCPAGVVLTNEEFIGVQRDGIISGKVHPRDVRKCFSRYRTGVISVRAIIVIDVIITVTLKAVLQFGEAAGIRSQKHIKARLPGKGLTVHHISSRIGNAERQVRSQIQKLRRSVEGQRRVEVDAAGFAFFVARHT